jgi:hypothetical protein
MPLTEKGRKIMSNMKSQYGEKKGEQVFYASKNKGTIKGVEGSGSQRHAKLGKRPRMVGHGGMKRNRH